jgi:anti-sigma factor RsiW
VTHLGQRLSALIDGELVAEERERVLLHLGKCASCRDEAAALRMLKRRMHALAETAADDTLTGRLMELSELVLAEPMSHDEDGWQAPPPVWPSHDDRPDMRAGRYFLAGSLVIFLAGLGTVAAVAGSDPQVQAPARPTTPSVDVLIVPREYARQQGAPVQGPPGQAQLDGAPYALRPGAEAAPTSWVLFPHR